MTARIEIEWMVRGRGGMVVGSVWAENSADAWRFATAGYPCVTALVNLQTLGTGSRASLDAATSFRELPKNPNTRQPYADVSLDLDRLIGDVVCFLDTRNLSEADKANLTVKLKRLDQAQLRARAVLDPQTLSNEDWEQALVSPNDDCFGDSTAFMSGGKMVRGSDIVKGTTPWWKFW